MVLELWRSGASRRGLTSFTFGRHGPPTLHRCRSATCCLRFASRSYGSEES